MMINNEYFELRDSSSSGQGLFAKKKIPKGTIVLIEEHLACSRNIIYDDDTINSYIEYPDIIPETIQYDLMLLGMIIKKLGHISQKYGNDWYGYFYKSNSFKPTKNESKYICQLCIKYNPPNGFDFIVDILNIIKHNMFSQTYYNNRECYCAYNFISYTASKLNHSHMFNCNKILFPKHLIIKTIEDIEQDEELTINYGEGYFESLGIKCQCGKCGKIHVPYKLKFSKLMYDREERSGYIKSSFNVSKEIIRFMNDKNIAMVNSGFELFHGLLYDISYKKKKYEKLTVMLDYQIIVYIRLMIDFYSKKYKLDTKEILIFIMLTFPRLIPQLKVEAFMEVLNSITKNYDIVFNVDIDFRKIYP